MDASTQRLVDYALHTRYADLPAELVHATKRRLIDSLACAMGSYHHPLSVEMRDLASQYSGMKKAHVWGSGIQTTPEMAAFANGVMLRVGENSDTYIGHGGGGHPSDMLSAILATADSCQADGRVVIEACVVAYDVYCTLMNITNFGAKGWDQVIHVVLGAVLGVGKIMGLNRNQLGHAVALALAPNMALRQTRHGELSSWKGCAGANAARNAVFAAVLAQRGVEGPSDIFEGKQGVWMAVTGFEWPSLKQLTSAHMIARTSLKSLPVCYHIQSAALSALQLHADVQPDDIESIHVETYPAAVEMAAGDPGQWSPRTSESADHSLPYVVATALALGRVEASCFAVSQLQNPLVLQLVKKVRVDTSDAMSALWPQTAPAKVTVRTARGQEFSAEVLYPLGHVQNPMSDAQLSAKFRDMFELKAEGAEQAKAALDALWTLDEVSDVALQVLTPLTSTRALDPVSA